MEHSGSLSAMARRRAVLCILAIIIVQMVARPALGQAAQWANLATVSNSTALQAGSLCATDGRDIYCDSSVSGLAQADRITSGTTYVNANQSGAVTISATSLLLDVPKYGTVAISSSKVYSVMNGGLGFYVTGNGPVYFGDTRKGAGGGAYISFNANGGANLQGGWFLGKNVALTGENGAGDDNSLMISKTGNGVNQTINVFTQTIVPSSPGTFPNLVFAANSYKFGLRDGLPSWNEGVDSYPLTIGANGNVGIGGEPENAVLTVSATGRANTIGLLVYPAPNGSEQRALVVRNAAGQDSFAVNAQGQTQFSQGCNAFGGPITCQAALEIYNPEVRPSLLLRGGTAAILQWQAPRPGVITSSGLVGVGTLTPTIPLEVSGTIGATDIQLTRDATPPAAKCASASDEGRTIMTPDGPYVCLMR